MQVAIFQPHLEFPWGYHPGRDSNKPVVLSDDARSLREYWAVLANALCKAFVSHGHDAYVDVRRFGEITPEAADTLDADLVVVPHRTSQTFQSLKKPALFYMQIIAPWLFVVDSGGWASHSSRYPCDYHNGDPASGVFEDLAGRLIGGNESKFAQPVRRSRWQLALKGEIPWRAPYVFFPCQIPHDQSIELFSPFPEVEIVRALAAWANRTRVTVVLKEHPANRRSMAPLREAATGPFIRWSEASIHDLISGASAVYTINSGVGFEALLHDKPVVTFGHTEYDCVSVRARPDTLDGAWEEVRGWRDDVRHNEYRKFVHWFCRRYAIDMSNEPAAQTMLDAAVAQAEKLLVDRVTA